LRGTRSLAYHVDMSRLLCSVRLVLHLVRRINQRFPKAHYTQTDRLLNGKTDRQKRPLIPCESIVDANPYSDDQQYV